MYVSLIPQFLTIMFVFLCWYIFSCTFYTGKYLFPQHTMNSWEMGTLWEGCDNWEIFNMEHTLDAIFLVCDNCTVVI